MKIELTIFYFYVTILTIECAAVEAPLDVITLDDITPAERDHLDYLEKEAASRPKRHGLLTALGEGIKSKISMLAQGSASASAGKFSKFSGGSSGHNGYHYDDHHHDVPHTYDEKAFDFWTLKKSVLNTLLQAAKAIKGGIIALKGQLIKGSGYLVSAKGKLISASGEAITNKGKSIAASALLSPLPDHHSHSSGYSVSGPSYDTHIEYGPSPSHIIDHSGPSGSSGEYEVSEHHKPPSSVYEPHKYGESIAVKQKTFVGPHAGILILKKIPYKDDVDLKLPKFKPLPPAPTFPSPITSLFTSFSYPKKYNSLSGHKQYSPYDDAWPSDSTKQFTEAKPTDEIPDSLPSPDKETQTQFLQNVKKPEDNGLPNQISTTLSTSNASAPSYQLFTAINKDQEQVFNALQNYPNLQLSLTEFGNNRDPFMINPNTLPSIDNFGPYPGILPPEFIAQHNLKNSIPFSTQFSSFPETFYNPRNLKPNEFSMNIYMSKPSKFNFDQLRPPPPTLANSFSFNNNPKVNGFNDVTRTLEREIPPSYEVLDSVSYKLGPNGPIKL